MKKIARFLVISWLGFGCLAPLLRAQAKFVDSSRYLFTYITSSSGRFPQYLDDVTAPKTGLYNKTLAATSAAGLLYASQSTTMGDGTFNGVMIASAVAKPDAGFRASADARVLVDYTVEKLSKYRLVMSLNKTVNNSFDSNTGGAVAGLGPPTALPVDGTLGQPLPSDAFLVAGNKLPPVSSGTQEFSGVLEPGVWRFFASVFNIPSLSQASDTTQTLTVDFQISAITPVVISQQPQTVAVGVGATAKLSVVATGDPLSFQWKKDGVPISGATSATLVLNNVQQADVGRYTVTVSNPLGSVTSDFADVRFATIKPLIVTNPASLTRFAGELTSFTVVSAGDFLSYQWSKDNVPIPNANGATLNLGAFQASMVGTYAVVVSNALGSVTSGGATLAVASRLLNLSTRAGVETGGNLLICGFVLRGSSNRKILVRAIGPRLADFGVPDVLANPTMTLYDSGNGPVASNDDWSAGGSAATQLLSDTFQTVGAFPLKVGDKDAALAMDLSPGSYTVQIRGVGDTRGVGLAEVYDTGVASSDSSLVNLSTRALVGTGGSILIQGISIQGAAKRVLVRAVGPRLADFGVPGVLADPSMKIVNSAGVVMAENDNWSEGSTATTQGIVDAAASTGAFPLVPGSRDAAIVITLPEGGYTVQVVGVGNTTGVALVEVYAF